MRLRLASLVCLASLALLVPARASAQDATLIGNVVDGTKAALPGATITATLIDTGRASTTIADARGEYRLRGLAPGRYRVQAELSGFSTVVIPEIELLVGQNRSLPFTMQVASLSETLTVTGEAPLVDVTRSAASGNIDSRQLSEIPVQGRDWQD
ncbi:MAG TPA: carboxypeptidase-like regulatory domain-containing protein, partial [Vicinamibacterales bacterium]